MNLGEIGLLAIAAAWLVQLVYSWKGDKAIRPQFIICYMLGVIALVVDDYLATSTLSYFELLTCVLAGIVLVRISTIKR